MRVFRLPPHSRWDLHSSGALRSIERLFVTDVSVQPIDPIFKCREMQIFDFFLNLKMGSIRCPETSVRNFSLSRVMPRKVQISRLLPFTICLRPTQGFWSFLMLFVHTAVWCLRDTPISSSVFRLVAQSPRVTAVADWRNGICTTAS